MDWLKKFFTEPGTLAALVTSGLIGFIVGVANGVVQKRHDGWTGFFSAVATGVTISLIVGLGIEGYVHNEAARLAIIGACAVISDDIRAGLKALGSGIRTDPLGTITRIFDALRARPAASASTPEKE